MQIESCKNGELFSIELDEIPVLSSEESFSKIENVTERHMALRMNMLENISKYISGKIFAEFGVYKGNTANKIMEIFPSFEAHLFDSFEGLPEDWDDWFRKGHFALSETDIPTFNSNLNITIHKGFFSETVPKFAEYLKNENKKLDFIHIDCDLYSSTKTIFDELDDFIKPGTIIHFDELIGIGTWYKNWKNGEYKALLEWAVKNKRSFEYLCRTDYTQVTIRIL